MVSLSNDMSPVAVVMSTGGIQKANKTSCRFHRNYHINGPVGPTSFWKLSDDVVDERTRRPPIDPLTFF